MSAYYNEHDPLKAEVLREAIKANAIAPGDVDERSISDVRGSDLRGYTQCHFFAGGGFWSLAGRLAGIPDDWPWWSGSCPCPSFSAAGKGGGFDDPRHLWPAWDRLIGECRPPVVFGEQADDAVGYGWLDLVQANMEAKTYALGKAVLGAHSVRSPNIRQRLYFVAELADSEMSKRGRAGVAVILGRRTAKAGRSGMPCNLEYPGRTGLQGHTGDGAARHEPGRFGASEGGPAPAASDAGDAGNATGERCGETGGGSGRPTQWNGDTGESGLVANAFGSGRNGRAFEQGRGAELRVAVARAGEGGRLDDAECDGREARRGDHAGDDWKLHGSAGTARELAGGRPESDFWGGMELIPCRNPKVPGGIEWRPIERGTFVLAARYPERVAELRLAGDAINVYTAKAFLEAYLGTRAA